METEELKPVDVIEQMCVQKDIALKPLRTAQDIMNPDFRTLTLDHTVNRCLDFMKARRVRHVPVVDLPYEEEKNPYFVGVISQRDVLRLSAADAENTGERKIDKRALRQLLVQIVARRPKSVLLHAGVQDVIAVMTANHIDMVPVLDCDDLVGIVTTTDLMRVLLRLHEVALRLCPELHEGAPTVDMASENSTEVQVLCSWASLTVQEIMTGHVISREPQDNLAEAIEVLRTGEFRHLPITDEQEKFVGLISDRDVLRSLPFAGRRPPAPPKRFREHLFATDPWTAVLQLPLENIMVRKVVHVSPSCSVYDAADTLCNKKISCLPVVDEKEKLRGIVTVTDLMRALLFAYEPATKACLTPSEGSPC